MSDSYRHLVDHLRSNTPEELAQTMVSLGPTFRFHGVPRSLEQLAQILLARETLQLVIGDLNLPQRQVLAGIVRCAKPDQQLRSAMAGPGGHYGGAWLYNGKTGVVDTDEVLSAFGADDVGERRDFIGSIVGSLVARLLIWPIGAEKLAGEVPKTLGVPGPAMELLAVRQGPARTVDSALSSCFNKPEVARIADFLGVGDETQSRGVIQSAVVAYLRDGERVKALLEQAPLDALDHLEKMAATGGRMHSSVYRQIHGYGGKWTIDPMYGDAETVWLARRGLIMPSGVDVVELPQEILAVMTDGMRFPLTMRPTPVATVKIDASHVAAQGQAAVIAAMRKLTRLMETFNAAPGILRKTGGLAVRETRRLAKLLEADEHEVRLWVDLLAAAGLLETVDSASPVVCPTETYDSWLAASSAERFAMILRAWLGIDTVLTLADNFDETPVPLYVMPEPYVTKLRQATLAALADLPEGFGCLAATRLAVTGEMTEDEAKRLGALSTAAAWYAPTPFAAIDHAPIYALYTLYEAELLGVAALGAPTPIGRALVSTMDGLVPTLSDILPAPTAKARFQADLTAVVTGTPTPELASLLDSIGNRESEGHAVVWRLSAATVRRGLDAGRDVSDLLSDLRDAAEGGLPQPLEYMIKDVSRSHGRMRVVRSACCIRSDDETLLGEMIRAKSLAKLGMRRIAPTVLISTRPPAETLAALRAAGYSPVLEAETGTTVVERVVGQRAPKRKQFFRDASMDSEKAMAAAKSLLQGVKR